MKFEKLNQESTSENVNEYNKKVDEISKTLKNETLQELKDKLDYCYEGDKKIRFGFQELATALKKEIQKREDEKYPDAKKYRNIYYKNELKD